MKCNQCLVYSMCNDLCTYFFEEHKIDKNNLKILDTVTIKLKHDKLKYCPKLIINAISHCVQDEPFDSVYVEITLMPDNLFYAFVRKWKYYNTTTWTLVFFGR
jgi:hypothetical protein